MTLARGKDFMAFDRSIDVHISKLRAKLESDPRLPKRIKTIWGSGTCSCIQHETEQDLHQDIFSFLLILIVTEIVIFALFGIIVGRYFQSEFDHYASAQVMVVKEVIDSKIRTASEIELSRNEPLKDFIRNWGEALGAQVWLQDSDGRLVVKSFSGDLPEKRLTLQKGRSRDLGDFKLYHGHKRGPKLYAVIPIKLTGEKSAELHVLFAKREPPIRKKVRLGLGNHRRGDRTSRDACVKMDL